MREEYVIQAYSPTAHQVIREFNLEMNNPAITDSVYATQIATAFAERLNRNQYLKATDWEPKVEWQQVGIETLPGYISSQN